jgi:hypothetical protein
LDDIFSEYSAVGISKAFYKTSFIPYLFEYRYVLDDWLDLGSAESALISGIPETLTSIQTNFSPLCSETLGLIGFTRKMIAAFGDIHGLIHSAVEELETLIEQVMTTLLGDAQMAPSLTTYLHYVFPETLPAWFEEADVEFQFFEVLLDPLLQSIFADSIQNIFC